MKTPEGFTFKKVEDELHIVHKRKGMWCMNVFLFVFLLFWLGALAVTTEIYLVVSATPDRLPVWMPVIISIICCGVAWFLIYSLFAQKTFRLSDRVLQSETRLLGLSWSSSVPRDSILVVRQCKEGGDHRDSFLSWGLYLDTSINTLSVLSVSRFSAKAPYPLLMRLPYVHSEWLGKIVAEWSGAELVLATNPEAEPCDEPKSRKSGDFVLPN